MLWRSGTPLGPAFVSFELDGAPNQVFSFNLGYWSGRLALTQVDPIDGGPSPHNIDAVRILVNLFHNWHPAHPSSPPSCFTEAYDVRTVLAHEFGHALQLLDVVDEPEAMMNGRFQLGETRQLTESDISGIRYLYPPRPKDPSPMRVAASAFIAYDLHTLTRQADIIIEGSVQPGARTIDVSIAPGISFNLRYREHRVSVLSGSC